MSSPIELQIYMCRRFAAIYSNLIWQQSVLFSPMQCAILPHTCSKQTGCYNVRLGLLHHFVFLLYSFIYCLLFIQNSNNIVIYKQIFEWMKMYIIQGVPKKVPLNKFPSFVNNIPPRVCTKSPQFNYSHAYQFPFQKLYYFL